MNLEAAGNSQTDVVRAEHDLGASLSQLNGSERSRRDLMQDFSRLGNNQALPALSLESVDHRPGVPVNGQQDYLYPDWYDRDSRYRPYPERPYQDNSYGQRGNDWYQELPDGTRIWRYPDGTYIRMSPDGAYERQNPDGSYVRRDARGNTVWHYADGRESRQGADGSLFSRNADGSTYEKTADGRQTWRYADGTLIKQNPDGSGMMQKPDGTSVEKKSDGTIIWTKPDGTVLTQFPDGSKEQRNPDGSVWRMNPDGTVTREPGDGGARIIEHQDGSRTKEYPDRSRVEVNAQGLVTQVVASNGQDRQYFYGNGGEIMRVKAMDGEIWTRQDQYTWVGSNGGRWVGQIAGVDQEGNAYYYPQQGQPFIHRRNGQVEPWNGQTPSQRTPQPMPYERQPYAPVDPYQPMPYDRPMQHQFMP